MTDTLGAALPAEMARVREILAMYHNLGPSGVIAAAGMTVDLNEATRALAEQDLPAMIRVYGELQGWEA